ncbi:hypothetical protein [Streptoalloteichus hindustanus]|uniref:Uncharacterized protein n=1 Tax=Streptoalloteichus hindustanus TaxID=2017 RepID=A0A1M5MG41_STRHI|nr:hypothetical protein [Streptoalloteichus hindustanus]SHG76137.1 hypothetical protein SAMN05444320_113105 [Streptoalloteichus hindustanus]
MSGEQDNDSFRHPDDTQVDVVAARFGFTVGQGDWESLVRGLRGTAPFTTLLDYALGLAVWTARQDADAVGVTDRDYVVERPAVVLVALALYRVARQQRIYDMLRVPMRQAVAVLTDDQRARQAVAQRPGQNREPSGRLREDDRAALFTAMTSGGDQPWQRWRRAALHILETNADDSGVTSFSGPVLHHRLSHVRWARVRHCWYEHPELPPIVPIEEGNPGLR